MLKFGAMACLAPQLVAMQGMLGGWVAQVSNAAQDHDSYNIS